MSEFKVLQTLATPNPHAIKFELNLPAIKKGSRSFPNIESAKKNLCASELFLIHGVSSVFFIENIVTVSKIQTAQWDDLIPAIADTLENQLVAFDVADLDEHNNSSQAHYNPALQNEQQKIATGTENHPWNAEPFFSLPISEQLLLINQILDDRIRPGLASDGGGIELLSIHGNVVEVRYQGACGNCPSSGKGTLSFIEDAFHRSVSQHMIVRIV